MRISRLTRHMAGGISSSNSTEAPRHRGTETVYRAWQQKILAYKEYWRTSKFRERYAVGEPMISFRVLVIT